MTPVALTPPRPREPDAPAATYDHAFQRLEAFLPLAGKTYAQKRNFDFGAGKHDGVSGLSPWLRHRLLLETDVLKGVLVRYGFNAAEKFVQEVFWRGYFKGWLEHRPEVWKRYRSNLVGQLQALERDANLAKRYDEAVQGQTGIACFDAWAEELVHTNYLHNHARMYVAAYIVHWRQIKWQAGARWFLQNLIDGDPASNNLSWQWIASTFANKPYFFNLDNVARYVGPDINVSAADNLPLAHSYERLAELLFPNLSSPQAS